MAVNTAITHGRTVDVDARTERRAAVVAARAFRAAGNVLRTVVDGVLIEWMRWWWRNRGFVIRTATESFMIGTRRRSTRRERSPTAAIIIGVGGVTRAGSQLKPKDASRVVIDKADWIETGLNRTSRVFPKGARGSESVVKADAELLRVSGEESHATSVDLIVLER